MKITAIKQQVKRADRYSIYVDERYTCSFSESELLKLSLRVGQEISPADLEALKDDALRDKAYDRALDLVSRRVRSEWEMRAYLKRKDYSPEVIDLTVSRLCERGYLDDREFAQRWVENRRLLKATSRRRLQQELRQKHVSSEVIDEVLAADDTDDLAVLRELVDRKRQQTKYQDDLKLMQYLSRQGYGYDDIKTALRPADD
jgi:regulatory protein